VRRQAGRGRAYGIRRHLERCAAMFPTVNADLIFRVNYLLSGLHSYG
jgi:hypothetical protein